MDAKMKPILAELVSLSLVLSLLLSGCGISLTPTANETEPSSKEPTPVQPNPEPVSPGSSPSYGGAPVVRVSTAPRVGETVNVTLSWEMIGTPVEPFNKVWLEFERYDPALYYPLGRGTDKDRLLRYLSEKFNPSKSYDVYEKDAATYQPVATVPHNDVIVEGNLVWEGAPLKSGDKVQLAGVVRFPEEGEWVVYTRFQAGSRFPWSQSEVQLTIGKDSGVFGWPKDYSNGGDWQPPKDNAPIAVTLKPGRAPLLGQPLNLTMVIQSDRDVAEGLAYLRLFRQEGSVRNKNASYQIEGNLSWNGSLKKGVPVELSGNVTFNEEGD